MMAQFFNNMKKLILLILCATIFCCSQIEKQDTKKDVYLLIGQSNMAGRGDYEIETDSSVMKNVFLLNEEKIFEPAKNPLNRYSTIRKVCDPDLQKIGIGYTFSKSMATFLKDSVYLIVNAKGGTKIEDFLKGGQYGYYEAILNRTLTALENNSNINLKAIIWHQGESDAPDTVNYLKNLKSMVEDFRRDLNSPNIPFIAGQVGEWNADYKDIRNEIEKIPDDIENAFLVSSKGLKNKDAHHFDTESYKKFGERYASVCQKVLYNNKISK